MRALGWLHSAACSPGLRFACAALKGIETAKARGLKGAELQAQIKSLSMAHLGGDLGSLMKPNPDMVRKDAVSHHILRLAYCQSEEKRRWFLSQELALFRCVPVPPLWSH